MDKVFPEEVYKLAVDTDLLEDYLGEELEDLELECNSVRCLGEKEPEIRVLFDNELGESTLSVLKDYMGSYDYVMKDWFRSFDEVVYVFNTKNFK